MTSVRAQVKLSRVGLLIFDEESAGHEKKRENDEGFDTVVSYLT